MRQLNKRYPKAGPTTVSVESGVELLPDLVFGAANGDELLGDLYRPRHRSGPCPVVLCIHGGGWVGGTRKAFEQWGRSLAEQGMVAFAIDYRLASAGAASFPGVLDDVAAAATFLRTDAKSLGVDSERMAMYGQSAGAHLAALSAFSAHDGQAPFASVPGIRALALCYGIFDLAAHWHHENQTRPGRRTAEMLLGASLTENRRVYFDASPIAYATERARDIAVLLAYGTNDIVVPHDQQSERFALALSQAGNEFRSVVLPGAGHYWASESQAITGSHSGAFAPRLIDFLGSRL